MAKLFKTLRTAPEPDPKVLISIVAQDQSRYTKFWAAYTNLLSAVPNAHVSFHVGNQMTKCRNDAIDDAIKLNCDYIWFIDDDHEFKPDILNRLLAHKKDIVGPLYCIRGYPFDPTARRLGPEDTPRLIFNVPASGPPGLHKVRATGTSGLLISKKVFTTIPRPWFIVGHLHPEMISEDFYFCDLAREHGFDIYLDTSTILEHFATMKVSIDWHNGGWNIITDMGQNYRLALPYHVNENPEEPTGTGTESGDSNN